MTAPFCRADAERLLGPAVIAAARALVDDAPPLRVEQREQVRAVFASARPYRLRPARPAAEAA